MKQIRSYLAVVCAGLFISTSLVSCYHDCDGFNDQYFSMWFPYQENQAFRFTNSVDTTALTTTVESVEKWGAYRKTGWYVRCPVQAEVRAVGPLLIYIVQQQEGVGNKVGDREFEIRIAGQVVYAQGVADTGVNIERFESKTNSMQLSNFTLNNKVYSEAQLLTKMDTLGAPVFELYIAKHKGIIGFKDLSDNKLWVLKD